MKRHEDRNKKTRKCALGRVAGTVALLEREERGIDAQAFGNVTGALGANSSIVETTDSIRRVNGKGEGRGGVCEDNDEMHQGMIS